MEGKRVQKPEPVAASCNGFLFWKTRDQVPEGGIYVLGRISRDFDVFLAPRPPWSLGAGLIWKQKGGYGTPKPAANGCSGPFLETPGRLPGRRVLRPRKNFAGFRRFSQTGTALEPRCGAGLEEKRSFLETPDRMPGRESTSSEEFRGISTIFSEDTAVVGRIRANRPVRNTGLRQRRDKLCSGSRCFPGTVDKREESFYDK